MTPYDVIFTKIPFLKMKSGYYLGDGGVQLFGGGVEFFFHLKDLLVAVGDFGFGIRGLLFGSLEFVLDL